MEKLAAMMESVLNLACGADEPDADGWNKYVVELHCVTLLITARPPRNGRVSWEVKGYENANG